MITDPHYIPYGHLNLNDEFWRQAQRDSVMIQLSKRLSEIFLEHSTAVIPKSYLTELGFNLSAECAHDYNILEFSIHWHWSSICLCVMSHGKYEDERDQIRFSKSEHEGKAYLSENIKQVNDPSCRWGKYILKDLKPVVMPEPPAQWSLF